MFKNEVIAFETLRKQYAMFNEHPHNSPYKQILEQLVNLVSEQSDLYYVRSDQTKTIAIYSHVFSKQDLSEMLTVANLKCRNMAMLCVHYLPDLTRKNCVMRILDSIISCILSINIFDKLNLKRLHNEYICIAYHRKSVKYYYMYVIFFI
jgi:hypothetical protein